MSGCLGGPPSLQLPTPMVPALEEGTRVRVSARTLGTSPRVARVVAVRADTLVFRPEGVPERAADSVIALPLRSLDRLEISAGLRPGKARLARLGLVSGLVIGGASGALTYTDPCREEPARCAAIFAGSSRQGAVISGALVGGLLGLVGGAVAGAVSPVERWEPIRLDPTARPRD